MKALDDARVEMSWLSAWESTNSLASLVRRLFDASSREMLSVFNEMSTLLADPCGAPTIELNWSMGITIRLSALPIPPRSRMAATVTSCCPMGEKTVKTSPTCASISRCRNMLMNTSPSARSRMSFVGPSMASGTVNGTSVGPVGTSIVPYSPPMS